MPRPRKIVTVVSRPDRPLQLRYRDAVTDKPMRVSSGTYDRQEAEKLAEQLAAKLTLSMPIGKSVSRVYGPDMLWEHFRHEYSEREIMHMRPKSASDSAGRLRIAEKIVKPRTLADMADRESLRRLQTALLIGKESRFGRPRATATVNGYMESIMTSLNWAAKQGWLERGVRIEPVSREKSDDMRGR